MSPAVLNKALSRFLGQVEIRRPLYAGVAKRNVASVRVLEKCSFTVVGEEEDGGYVMKLAAD